MATSLTPEPEPKSTGYLTQKQRLAAVVLNVGLFLLLSHFVTGEWIPSASTKRLWFLSGLGLFFLTMLSAPWFRPPRNALVNGVTSALLLSSLDLSAIAKMQTELNVFRWSVVGIAAVVCVSSIMAMVFVDADPDKQRFRKCLGTWGFQLGNTLGKGELVFTPPAFISIFGFYQDAPGQQMWLLFGWMLVVSVRPVELLFRLARELKGITEPSTRLEIVGTISRFDNPNIVRVALKAAGKWNPNAIAVACLPNGTQVNVLPLFSHNQESQLVGTGLCHDAPKVPVQDAVPGNVYLTTGEDDVLRILKELSGVDAEVSLIGFVVEDSTIATMKFEVFPAVALEEGKLVFCRQDGRTIFYQILDAKTTEESFSQNPRGKHIVSAAQLGCLDGVKGFLKYGWLPSMNLPVFVSKTSIAFDLTAPKADEMALGKVPGSDITVRAGFYDLLEYHTAILGITGTGKTELAFDIIRQALTLNAKVFCVDFTNEYKARLKDSNPQPLGLNQAKAEELDQKLFAVETGTYGAPKEKEALKKFVDEIRKPIQENVEAFLSSDGPGLGIFELPEITNTKATLRATELYLSSIMEWARTNRRARRVLIVLEEAHTIIPETVGSGFDYDTQWVVGKISQIALQGRKYGVGLLVVSQRTALVSKSILSQCGTCVAFSMVDKTSLDYLANVFSQAHVQSIPNLRFLEAIAYGKGVRSERPVLVKREYDQKKKAACDALNQTLRNSAEVKATNE